jgi:hypothetical protein
VVSEHYSTIQQPPYCKKVKVAKKQNQDQNQNQDQSQSQDRNHTVVKRKAKCAVKPDGAKTAASSEG